MLKNIDIKPNILEGLSGSKKGCPTRYKLFGGDTETVNGKPMTLQLWNGVDENNIYFEWVNEKNIFSKFIDYMTSNILLGYPNIYYFHNLKFDLGIIFYPYLDRFQQVSNVKFIYKGIKVNAIYSQTCMVKFYYRKTTIYMLDSMSFMSGGSLDHWAKTLDLPQKKMARPEGIGEIDYRDLPDSDEKKKYFIEYAKCDVITQWYLGDWIMKQHKKYDVPVAVSSANFSAKVFKRSYLPIQDNIPFPPKDCLNGALLSYHGGRNGYYWNKPAIFENCCEVDISSSYPYAMVSIPNFVDCEYKLVKDFIPNMEGIYEIVGTYNACKYPPFFTHDLKTLENGTQFRLWLTSYEIREALKDKTLQEGKWQVTRGYVIVPANRTVINPFSDFVNEFYSKKEIKGIDKAERHMYKIILNSLYGKFIQTIHDDFRINVSEQEEIERGFEIRQKKNGGIEVVHTVNNKHIFVAGGLFQPVIATMITGFARAYLHRLEHHYKAIHSSTDSVKFNANLLEPEKIASYRRKLAGNKDKGILGSSCVEVIGKCILLRNKLYLHYNEKGEIEKQAFHGFAGRQKELLQVINTRDCNYTIKKIMKIREAFRQGLQPFMMTELKKELDVDLREIEIVKNY